MTVSPPESTLIERRGALGVGSGLASAHVTPPSTVFQMDPLPLIDPVSPPTATPLLASVNWTSRRVALPMVLNHQVRPPLVVRTTTPLVPTATPCLTSVKSTAARPGLVVRSTWYFQ